MEMRRDTRKSGRDECLVEGRDDNADRETKQDRYDFARRKQVRLVCQRLQQLGRLVLVFLGVSVCARLT